MAELFADSRLKIDRARTHLNGLSRYIQWHIQEHPPKSDLSLRRLDNGQDGYRLNTSVKGLPRETSAMIGDVVHNLRAALDLAAVEMVARSGGNTNNVYFPFAGSAEEFELAARRKNFHRAGEEAMAVLERIRPYAGGNVLLRGLHDLDICDKHRAIIPAHTLVNTPQIEPYDFEDDLNAVKMRIVEGSTATVAYTFPNEPNMPFGGEVLVPTLEGLVEAVESVLGAFSAVVSEGLGEPEKAD